MKDNRLVRRDIDKIRRRLDLILKDCARYMQREQPDHYKTHCMLCKNIDGNFGDKNLPCEMVISCWASYFYFLRFVGIYDTGARPPALPKELRKIRGRVRIHPAPKVFNEPLTKKAL